MGGKALEEIIIHWTSKLASKCTSDELSCLETTLEKMDCEWRAHLLSWV